MKTWESRLESVANRVNDRAPDTTAAINASKDKIAAVRADLEAGLLPEVGCPTLKIRWKKK